LKDDVMKMMKWCPLCKILLVITPVTGDDYQAKNKLLPCVLLSFLPFSYSVPILPRINVHHYSVLYRTTPLVCAVQAQAVSDFTALHQAFVFLFDRLLICA